MKFCDMEEEVYQEFDWSTPDENPMYETGKGSELSEIKFSGTFDEVRKQSQKILRITGSKMSINHDAILLGMDDSMPDNVGTLTHHSAEGLDMMENLQDRLLHEIECFRQSGDGFGRVLDLSAQSEMRLCDHVIVHEHVDPRASHGMCKCGARISAHMDDRFQKCDTLISFCGLQTYQRGEQREILLEIVKSSKNVLIVQGPLKIGDVDVSVEINFIIPNVKMVIVEAFVLWYYDHHEEQEELERNNEHWQTAFKTINGEPGWEESDDLKRVVLVGISNSKCLGIVNVSKDVERCLVDVAIKYQETIPEALARGLLEIGCGDLSYDFLGVTNPSEGECQLFVYGSYDDRINQRGYVKFVDPATYVDKVNGKRSKTGHLMKVLNLLVKMKQLKYSMQTLNQYMAYAYRLGDDGREERFCAGEWQYHENVGRISVHMVEKVSENDLIRCSGKLIQHYKPKKINLRSGNQIIGKAYRLEENLYTVGLVIERQFEKNWCNLSGSVKIATVNDECYQMAGHYLGLSDQELKRGFLLMRGQRGNERVGNRSVGECIFKRCPGDLEATEELWQELIQ